MTSGVILSLSVVSHGQGDLITSLLDDLAHSCWNNGLAFEVIVTLNIPEEGAWLTEEFSFPLRFLHNQKAKGFGANHNAAFAIAQGKFFAVVNPDIRLAQFRVAELLVALELPDAGVCGPLVMAPSGVIEDSARRFPTFYRLLRRKLLREREPNYRVEKSPVPVDWLAGMFLFFPSAIYRAIGGFDERYFMYLEDVEIARRLQRHGWRSLWVGSTAVIHDAARASRRNWRHLRWHMASLVRYFLGRPKP